MASNQSPPIPRAASAARTRKVRGPLPTGVLVSAAARTDSRTSTSAMSLPRPPPTPPVRAPARAPSPLRRRCPGRTRRPARPGAACRGTPCGASSGGKGTASGPRRGRAATVEEDGDSGAEGAAGLGEKGRRRPDEERPEAATRGGGGGGAAGDGGRGRGRHVTGRAASRPPSAKWCPEPDSNRYAPEGQRGLSSPCLHSTIRAWRAAPRWHMTLSGGFLRSADEWRDVVLFY